MSRIESWRLQKLDQPLFGGEDPDGWILKAKKEEERKKEIPEEQSRRTEMKKKKSSKVSDFWVFQF